MYVWASLRSRLKHCFVSRIMEPFLGKEIKARRPYSHVQYDMFCSCRLTRGKEKMARCDSCLEWFHKSCEKIPGCESQKWFCRSLTPQHKHCKFTNCITCMQHVFCLYCICIMYVFTAHAQCIYFITLPLLLACVRGASK